jgi:hypothetical protein
MHCVNSSIFYSKFLTAPWLSQQNKIRLLEWKGRLDLCMYASRRSPQTLMDEIKDYQPKMPSTSGADPWEGIFKRLADFKDDGHAVKLGRAIAHGQEVCKKYEGKDGFRVTRDMWLNLGHMVIDSVEDSGKTWVRSAGFDEAWEDYQNRPKSAM